MSTIFIKEIQSIRNLKIECPYCSEEVPAKKIKMFSMYEDFPSFAKSKMEELRDVLATRKEDLSDKKSDIKERRIELKNLLEGKPPKIEAQTESINFGKIVEKIIPSFEVFPYEQGDCRQLFEPIDYIVFSNLCNNGKIEFITFSDVKTGRSKLNRTQKQIKSAIENGQTSHNISLEQ